MMIIGDSCGAPGTAFAGIVIGTGANGAAVPGISTGPLVAFCGTMGTAVEGA